MSREWYFQDVFTVSVGNLPPQASVLIKITYVAEITVDGELINFVIPGSVAPWDEQQNLDQVTQVNGYNPAQSLSTSYWNLSYHFWQ